MGIDFALKKIAESDKDQLEHFISAFATDLLMTQKMAYDASDRVEYVGIAIPGTATAEAKWLIKKLTYGSAGVTDVKFASGSNKFIHVWDSRAGYSYS